MSFQLAVQLPPGQCWKVMKQTDTKWRVHVSKCDKGKLSDLSDRLFVVVPALNGRNVKYCTDASARPRITEHR